MADVEELTLAEDHIRKWKILASASGGEDYAGEGELG
jgi:hypothetical protein